MSRIVTACCLAVAVLLGAAPLSPSLAQLGNVFGPDAITLTPAEREMMRNSIVTVLEEYVVGATSRWNSAETHRAGEAVLDETFERQGMRCGQVTHRYTEGGGRSYTAPICRVADGSWKLAF
jgi:surface antigen